MCEKSCVKIGSTRTKRTKNSKKINHSEKGEIKMKRTIVTAIITLALAIMLLPTTSLPASARDGFSGVDTIENGSAYLASLNHATVRGVQGTLPLRSAPSDNDDNIIGRLNNGNEVELLGCNRGNYTWVYSPKLEKSGWVDVNYLK